MTCITHYDALLILANFKCIIEKGKMKESGNIETMFFPMFEVFSVDGCFRLKLNETYVMLFSEIPARFINETIAQINPLLEYNGTGCPNEKDAKMVIFEIKIIQIQ